jgi:long-chain acyl-CoA synthetase
MTLVEMLARNSELFPDKTAIIYKDSIISYREFRRKSNALANFFIRTGLQKNQRVGLLVEKTPEAIISFLGVATAGGVFYPIDYNQNLSHLQAIIDQTTPSALIVSDKFQPLLSKLRLSCPDNKIIVISPKTKQRYHTLGEIFDQEKDSPPKMVIEDDDVAYLNFTSGTTGLPKGAVCTHANIYWNTLSSIESLGLTPKDIHLCLFPVFSHPHELFARPLYLGGTIVLVDDFLPNSVAKAISAHKVTCMMAIALVYESLARYHASNPLTFSSLRVAESGGMHVSPTLIEEFKEQFNVAIAPVWGSTETTGIAIATSIHDEYHPGSIGKPCPYYEVKIVDENGNELPPNEIGGMALRGPAVCSGYFENPKETEQHMKNGWLFTDDLVRRDSQGYYYFVGRKSGMMKVAGLRVFPAEIEDVLRTHPKIAEVAVVKVRDQLVGEAPKAVIVLKNGQNLDEKEIRKYCGMRLERYKVPGTIEFRSELPKTPSGKILYRCL